MNNIMPTIIMLVMYYIYGISRSSLLIESTDSMILCTHALFPGQKVV